MEKGHAQHLFRKYAPAIAYVVVKKSNGDEEVGSAFHVGEGVFVTARHVVEGCTLKEVRLSEPVPVATRDFLPEAPADYDETMRQWLGFVPMWRHYQKPLEIVSAPVFHNDPRIDVAAFVATGMHPNTPIVRLGAHLDDWIKNEDWILSEAIVLGYPPIPFTMQPELVAIRAEVNAVIVPYDAPKVHFIVSGIPRGGFSGGLVLSESDFVLGLVSRSLLRNRDSEELGFFSVLSVEPIFECLAVHKLLPAVQKGRFGDFWNSESTAFLERGSTGSGREVAYVKLHDDGKKLFLDVWAEEHELLAAALTAAKAALGTGSYTEGPGGGASTRLLLSSANDELTVLAKEACEAAKQALRDGGLFQLHHFRPG